MENVVSIATENFIKTIYKFQQRDDWDTRPGSIARELGITNAAATDMARKLALKKRTENGIGHHSETPVMGNFSPPGSRTYHA
jgi:hypothetical protein